MKEWLRSPWLGAIICLLLPAKLLWRALGSFRAPGLGGEGLYGELFAAATIRRWWEMELDPGWSDTMGGEAWWPESPLASFLLAVLPTDPGFSLGIVVVILLFLSGFGPYLLARKLLGEASPLSWWIAALVVQTGPSCLRGVPGVELAVLGVGVVALALAVPKLAWVSGLLSWPGAVFFGIWGVFTRDYRLLIAALPVLGVLAAPSSLPGALRELPPLPAAAPGYLAANGAVFPLPPAEAAQLIPTIPGEPVLWSIPLQRQLPPRPMLPGGAPSEEAPEAPARPWIGAIAVPMQRIYGGPVAVLGAIALLFMPGLRRYGLAALGILLGTTLLWGWQQFPDEVVVAPRTVAALRILLEESMVQQLPGGESGAAGFGALVTVLGALGIAGLVARHPGWAILPVISILLENPRLVAPVTSVLPDPMMGMLSGLPAGKVLVFPSPFAPFFQGSRPQAALLWELASAGKSVYPTPTMGETGAIRLLTSLTGLPVDTQSAASIYAVQNQEESFNLAFSEGTTYLLLDLGAIPEPMRPQLDGWLAAKVGLPLAKEGSRMLYDLQSGPAGIVPR